MKLYEITAKDGIKETFSVDKGWSKKEIKDYVIENPNCSYNIRTLKKVNFPEGEKIISTDAYYSYLYARYAIKGRFKLGEEAILNSDYAEIYKYYIMNPLIRELK